ncbi:MAG: chromate efflux transporter [Chloroflexota bacterium]
MPAPASFPATDLPPLSRRLLEVVLLFLKFGFTAFGGPAAHVALFHDEVVKRRKWLDEQRFLDLIGATNLIPGPNSTEIVIHIGFLRAGWLGFLFAGLCFTLPATLIVLALASVYVRFGSAPQAGWLLYGIKPVIIAVILQALLNLGKKALKDRLTGAAGLLTLVAYFLGANEIALLFIAGLLVMLFKNLQKMKKPGAALAFLPLAGVGLPALASIPFSLPVLFFTFLKIGSVLYGSGYVLLAFLKADFVTRLGWITDQQLIDAVAIGQVTPGPLFTAATFIGYLLGGAPGALLATVGIFLPSFVFVALSKPLIPRLRNSPWAGSMLDGVNAASLGLMAGVTWQLGVASLTDPLTLGLALVSLYLLLRYKVSSTWLIAGGALVGLVSMALQ